MGKKSEIIFGEIVSFRFGIPEEIDLGMDWQK